MIEELKPYPVYKDSGVAWLGKVPEHWDVRRLKQCARRFYSGGTPQSTVSEYYCDPPAGLPWLTIADITDQRRVWRSKTSITEAGRGSRNLEVVPLGTLLYSMYASLGAVAMLEIDAAVNQAIIGISTNPSLASEFGLYWLEHLRPHVVQLASSSTQANLNAEKVRSLPVFRPPSVEQSSIVRYLDHEGRRVRHYIRAKQKLIKLLGEQKQSIIHRAVTRGLDPNVRLKPSGVEWVKDVPEHWEVRRNGRSFAQRNETGFPDLPILEVSLRTGVRIRGFDTSERKQVMSDRARYKKAAKGDISYNMMRMWQGAVGVAPADGLVSPAYVVARPLEGTEPRYFSYLFRTVEYMREVDRYSRGIVKDRNRLYWEDFKQMPSLYPPTSEQSRIADAIDKETQATEDALARVHGEIALVREFRTRLIADVVTGKFDVREAAAKLPEESADEPEEPIDDIADVDAEVDEAEATVEEGIEA